MELILINDTKLKIMLTEEDMVRYDLDCDCANYDNTETRKAFWNILDEAKHQTGFDAASDRVFIQLYPSKEGGCEMYVTKVGLLHHSSNKPTPCNLHAKISPKPQTFIYEFETLRNMISACRLIANYPYVCSNAWISDHRTCCLFIDFEQGKGSGKIHGILNEFGNAVQTRNIYEYIKEYGKLLFSECAIEELSAF